MTRVDFYILGDGPSGDPDIVACRLAAKAWGLGHAIFVHALDDAHARALDERLWTWQQGSFVPHALAGAAPELPADVPAPVLIGWGGEPPADHWDLLINLQPGVPAFFSRYQRVAELVARSKDARQRGRERYQFYRDRGYELHTHHL